MQPIREPRGTGVHIITSSSRLRAKATAVAAATKADTIRLSFARAAPFIRKKRTPLHS